MCFETCVQIARRSMRKHVEANKGVAREEGLPYNLFFDGRGVEQSGSSSGS
jgi:hypothetical protein